MRASLSFCSRIRSRAIIIGEFTKGRIIFFKSSLKDSRGARNSAEVFGHGRSKGDVTSVAPFAGHSHWDSPKESEPSIIEVSATTSMRNSESVMSSVKSRSSRRRLEDKRNVKGAGRIEVFRGKILRTKVKLLNVIFHGGA